MSNYYTLLYNYRIIVQLSEITLVDLYSDKNGCMIKLKIDGI